MVYRKKGAKPDQKAQGKKPVSKGPVKDLSSIIFDDDDNMDSDNSVDAVVTKTPKGKQTPNEKRVSFQVPGRNTPAKTPVGKKQATPAKQNSVSKKPATPGKADLEKFKGIEKQGKKKRFQPEEEDDDDDDDDEDDKDFVDLSLNMGSDDDEDDDDDDDEDEEDDDDDEDEEEDDDDDDDDDDEDDEDEEEEEINQKKPIGKNQKQNAVQAKQTPVKKNDKQNALTPKNVQTPKGAQTPKSKESQSPKSAKKDAASPKQSKNLVWASEEERRNARDATQLYLGNLPKEVTGEELKELSSDIVSVNLLKRPKKNFAFAFLQFASEAKAEENLQVLKTKTFKGATLSIDYVGSKSSRQSKEAPAQYNPKRLYVSGLPTNVAIHQIAKFFPKCHSISLNQSPVYRAATVCYWSEEDANAAFEETKDVKVAGVPISVLHSRMGKQALNKRKRNKKNKMGNGPSAKKMRPQESDDEE